MSGPGSDYDKIYGLMDEMPKSEIISLMVPRMPYAYINTPRTNSMARAISVS